MRAEVLVMPKKASIKKVVIFIVEGGTDKSALETILKKIYSNKDIHFEVTGGDITSDESTTIENIEEKIYEYVKRCIKWGKFKKSDIWSVIQIFDTDGAYIPEEFIKCGENENFLYTTTGITAKNIEQVKIRNSRKSKLMNHLKSISTIKDIHYKGYYFSCNLDHALYNKQNLTLEEKIDYADAFYDNFIGKEKLFVEFLKMDVINGVPDSYIESWRYIREGTRSLERHTNLHVYFSENPYL